MVRVDRWDVGTGYHRQCSAENFVLLASILLDNDITQTYQQTFALGQLHAEISKRNVFKISAAYGFPVSLHQD